MVHKVVALCLGLCYWLLGLGGTPPLLHDAPVACGGHLHAGASHPQGYEAVLGPHEARHMIAIRRLFNPARGSVWHDGLSCASGIISAWRLARLPYIVMLAILPCMVQLCTLYVSGIESIIKPPITSNPTLTHSDYTQIRATCTKYRDHCCTQGSAPCWDPVPGGGYELVPAKIEFGNFKFSTQVNFKNPP